MQHSRYLIKGSSFRAYVKQLEECKKLEAVLAKASPAAIQLARNLPMPSSWVDAHLLAEIIELVNGIGGREAVLRLGRDAVQKQMLPFFTPMLRGIMRVVGVTPQSLFSRYQSILKPIVQGTEYRYTVLGPRSGSMDVAYDTDKVMPWSAFAQNFAGFEAIFDVCGVEGRVGEPEIRSGQTARFALSW
jgi:uncharacterized protein (TIGR02265 family)